MSASNGGLGALVAAALLAAAATPVSAHRLDECLQATRIDIAPDRVSIELTVTPGAAVADSLLAGIDTDSNGTLTAAERTTFVRSVIGELDATIDGSTIALEPGDAAFDDETMLRRGDGTIHVRASGRLDSPRAGRHELTFRNRYRRDISVYLANALVPANDAIAIVDQARDAGQHDITIAFAVSTEHTLTPVIALGGLLAACLLASVWPAVRAGPAHPRPLPRMR